MSMLASFNLVTPSTVEDALAQRADKPNARYIAGGTDFVPNLRRGIVEPELLVALDGIDELREITETKTHLVIGAGVTLVKLAETADLLSRFPALEAVNTIAGPNHRECATVGGNLCLDTRCVFYNQSAWWRKANQYCLKLKGDTCHVAPQGKRCHAAFSGDLAPAFLALGAEVEIASANGRNWQPLADLYRDDGADHLTLDPAELVVAVRIPLDAANLRSGYLKSRIRQAVDFPLAGVAVALRREGDGLAELHVGLTGTNSRPILVDGLDDLTGTAFGPELLDTLVKRIGLLIKPMRTTVMPGLYRRHVAGVLVRRLVTRLFEESA